MALRKVVPLCFAILFIALTSMAVRADVIYSYSIPGAGSVGPWSWSFRAPSFLTTDTSVSVSDFVSVNDPLPCTITGASLSYPTSTQFLVSTFVDSTTCGGNSQHSAWFLDGPVDHFGSYAGDFGSTLIVRDAVPEPASLLLLGASAAALIGWKRRNLSR